MNGKFAEMTICVLLSATLLAFTSTHTYADRGLSRITNSSPHTGRTPILQGKYRAIVIGNNNYTDPEKIWGPLNTAISDARSIAHTLTHQYGFSEVQLLLDATRRDILNAFTKIQSQTQNNDSVLVYYAGHGFHNDATQEAYWIPVDAQGWDDSYFVSNARIKEKLAVIANKAKHTLMISDSCFSGTLLRGAKRAYTRMDEPFYIKIAQRKSVQILAAGGTEFVDDNYRSSGHSPFTYFLLKELKENNKSFYTISSLSTNLSRLVANNVNQTPQSGILHGAGDEGGEFIFARISLKSNNDTDRFELDTATAKTTTTNQAVELSLWNSILQLDEPALYLNYLEKYPHGMFSAIARHKLHLVAPQNPEFTTISEMVGKYKSSLESRNIKLIEFLSEFEPQRGQFLLQFLAQYKSFNVNVLEFKHIGKEHKGIAQIKLSNLINNNGHKVNPAAWSQFNIQIAKNTEGDWRIYW